MASVACCNGTTLTPRFKFIFLSLFIVVVAALGELTCSDGFRLNSKEGRAALLESAGEWLTKVKAMRLDDEYADLDVIPHVKEQERVLLNRISKTSNPEKLFHILQWEESKRVLFPKHAFAITAKGMIPYEGFAGAMIKELMVDKELPRRWENAFTPHPFGSPALFKYPYPPHTETAPELVHLSHHVWMLEAHMGQQPVERAQLIVVVGAGYGAMPYLLRRNLGYTGRLLLLDLPVAAAVQRLYLPAVGITVSGSIHQWVNSPSGTFITHSLQELRGGLHALSLSQDSSSSMNKGMGGGGGGGTGVVVLSTGLLGKVGEMYVSQVEEVLFGGVAGLEVSAFLFSVERRFMGPNRGAKPFYDNTQRFGESWMEAKGLAGFHTHTHEPTYLRADGGGSLYLMGHRRGRGGGGGESTQKGDGGGGASSGGGEGDGLATSGGAAAKLVEAEVPVKGY